jgi:hypothetical protein
MVYEPPTGHPVVINFTTPYSPPTEHPVVINFGSSVETSIVSQDITLETIVPIYWVQESVEIVSANVVLESIIENELVDPLIGITASDLFLESLIDSSELQILPDIINHSIILETFLTKSDIGGNRVTDLPTNLHNGVSVVYGDKVSVDVHYLTLWSTFYKVDVQFPVFAKDFLYVDCFLNIVWGTFYKPDINLEVKYNDAVNNIDISLKSMWGSFYWVDKFHNVKYSGNKGKDNSLSICYGGSKPNDKIVSSSWDKSIGVDKIHAGAWSGPVPNDIDYTINYGPRALYKFCFEVYQPPPSHVGVNFVFPPRNAVFDGTWGNSIHFIMDSYSSDPRCEYKHMYTGVRDTPSPPGEEVEPIIPFKLKQVYYMFNTVLVKEIPSNAPIEVFGVGMVIDRDSWLWQLSMDIGDKKYLDLIKPVAGGFRMVEVNVNGWKWIFTIEGWQTGNAFGSGRWNVSGRSPSLILGDPICVQKSYVHTGLVSTGSSIIQDILDAGGSGYSISYDAYNLTEDSTQSGFDPGTGDWSIPANAFSYSNQTDIQAIQTLVDSIGGYVQTEANFYNYTSVGGSDNRKLNILPKYSWQPWKWNSDIPQINYKTLDKSITWETSSTYRKNPDYFGVYMIGGSEKSGNTNGKGIFCNIYREGYGPSSLHAPIITGPLFTTEMIAQEKGRMILGDSGMWMDRTVSVFSLFPEGTPPGLFKVGDIVRVTENAVTSYRGIVTSVSINAQVSNGAAFEVSQTLGISEYIGEWV